MAPETDQKTRRNFDRFLNDLGTKMVPQMAPKLDPKSTPKRPKIDQNPTWSPEATLGRSWVDFGSIWGRFGIDLGSILGGFVLLA